MDSTNKKEDRSQEKTTISPQLDYSITAGPADSKRFNRAKAIRLKCLDCCVYQTLEVRLCPSVNCPLWRYRMGKEERDSLYFESHPKKHQIYYR